MLLNLCISQNKFKNMIAGIFIIIMINQDQAKRKENWRTNGKCKKLQWLLKLFIEEKKINIKKKQRSCNFQKLVNEKIEQLVLDLATQNGLIAQAIIMQMIKSFKKNVPVVVKNHKQTQQHAKQYQFIFGQKLDQLVMNLNNYLLKPQFNTGMKLYGSQQDQQKNQSLKKLLISSPLKNYYQERERLGNPIALNYRYQGEGIFMIQNTANRHEQQEQEQQQEQQQQEEQGYQQKEEQQHPPQNPSPANLITNPQSQQENDKEDWQKCSLDSYKQRQQLKLFDLNQDDLNEQRYISDCLFRHDC